MDFHALRHIDAQQVIREAAVELRPLVLRANLQPAAGVLQRKEIEITVDLGVGSHAATMWTCDFSADYVKINAEYRT